MLKCQLKCQCYYKAKYHCDETLAALVSSYGVVLSLQNMPGEDFLTEQKLNLYTESPEPFRQGAEATSGSVVGIMKDTNPAQFNAKCGETKIDANPYIIFEGETVLVGDRENPGKTVRDKEFDGIAYSLRSVMDAVETDYYTYTKPQRSQLSTPSGKTKAWIGSPSI